MQRFGCPIAFASPTMRKALIVVARAMPRRADLMIAARKRRRAGEGPSPLVDQGPTRGQPRLDDRYRREASSLMQNGRTRLAQTARTESK
jgi:hypothetical protein